LLIGIILNIAYKGVNLSYMCILIVLPTILHFMNSYVYAWRRWMPNANRAYANGAHIIPLDRAHGVFDIHILRHIPDVHIVRNDFKSDVHDHEIQNSLRCAIGKLKKWYVNQENALPADQVLKQIKEYIFNEYKGEYTKKEDAYSTIRSIEKLNGNLEGVKMREQDILSMVWQRIIFDKNADHCGELKSNLLELLADSTIRLDSPYCLTGRVTRIVQSLESLDYEGIVNIRSTDFVEKEMQNKIPILIKQFFETQDQEKQESYDNGNNEIAVELQKYIDGVLRKDYLETGILTDSKFDKLINLYLAELM
jgi:hypothetical protein